MDRPVSISIVILTYQRMKLLRQLLAALGELQYRPLEIIVVDNHSDEDVAGMVGAEFPGMRIIALSENAGAVGRNVGIKAAGGEIIVTIDDDIFGLTDQYLAELATAFADPKLGAACFNVLDAEGEKVSDWCHHYPVETHAGQEFVTNDFPEGAVAFRRATLAVTGIYPESFFISHEGPDLACRILDHGYEVRYLPGIAVTHHHSPQGRASWRRYYYDTRNTLWLAIRNFPFGYGFRYVFVGMGAMLVYAVRDGFFRYWLKGVIDSLRGLGAALETRKCLTPETMALMRGIDRHRPGVFTMARKRLFQREVRI